MQMFLFERFPIRAVHHQAAQVHVYLAGDYNGFAHRELVYQPGLVEPGEAQITCPIAESGFDDLEFVRPGSGEHQWLGSCQ